MDKMKNVAKGGWHPQGSVRSEHKHINQVAGWVGHGKQPTNNSSKALEHSSRPLTSLQDPDSFGPPPKNVNFHGEAALVQPAIPIRRDTGTSLSAGELQPKGIEEQGAAQPVQKAAPPRVPYRANTTGLSTTGLPKPPIRQIENGEQSATASPTAKPKPSLPPRLPPRQNSHPTASAPSPPPDYSSATQRRPSQDQQLNQGALGRLGKAGVSVPGLGIGGGQASSPASNTWRKESSSTNAPPTSSPTTTQSPSISSLHNRFSKMTTSPTSSSPNAPPTAAAAVAAAAPSPSPSQGTTFAQKQAALQTATQFRNDPSSISLADARTSAATANNFRERHGEQVATGWKGANALNKKYDVANRVGGLAGQNGSASPVREDVPPNTMRDSNASPAGGDPSTPAFPWANEQQGQSVFKKAPPPPPVKRIGTGSGRGGSGGIPPPVPLGSKPRT